MRRGQLCHRLERRWECDRSRPKEQGGRGRPAGSLGKWVCGECRQRQEEGEQRKAPRPTLGPKQLTWGAGGFLADPLQIPTPSRKLPAVSWPWDSKQLTPCLMMPGSTSFTGTLRGKAGSGLFSAHLGLTHAYPEGSCSQLPGHQGLSGEEHGGGGEAGVASTVWEKRGKGPGIPLGRQVWAPLGSEQLQEPQGLAWRLGLRGLWWGESLGQKPRTPQSRKRRAWGAAGT